MFAFLSLDVFVAFNLVPKNLSFDVTVYVVLRIICFFVSCINVILTVLGNVKYYFLHVKFDAMSSKIFVINFCLILENSIIYSLMIGFIY